MGKFHPDRVKDVIEISTAGKVTPLVMGQLYLESVDQLAHQPEFSSGAFDEIKLFVNTMSHPDEYCEKLHNSFSGYLNYLDYRMRIDYVKKLIEVLVFVGEKYGSLVHDIVDVFSELMTTINHNGVLMDICKGLGRLGSAHDRASNHCISLLTRVVDHHYGVRVLDCVCYSLESIGYTWMNKKSIYGPLLLILKSPRPKLRLHAIRAIKTQLGGYWERPVQVLKEIVLYDDDMSIRYAALTCLGDTGRSESLSIREAIYDLITLISEQVHNMKHEYHHQLHLGHKGVHIKSRLKESKEILKILYHYAKFYKSRTGVEQSAFDPH